MSVIQGTGASIYLAAHMKEQARSMSIDPRKEDEKEPLTQSTKAVVVALSDVSLCFYYHGNKK